MSGVLQVADTEDISPASCGIEAFAKRLGETEKDGTSTILVEHLEKKLAQEKDSEKRVAISFLIARAKEREFDDYNDDSDDDNAFPKATLEGILDRMGFADLAKNVRDGVYD